MSAVPKVFATTEFFASGTGSGGGKVILYQTNVSFEEVTQHYITEMAKRGYAVNPRPIYTGGVQFTRNPEAQYPAVCFYLEPYPADNTATHLLGHTAQTALKRYRPDYTIAFWVEWSLPRSKAVC